ncbi:MAG: DMT family transporter [Bacteroidales bacterium]|jgi:drug/metabolite transporter (DMT)-like permease|nr:DMT family transporter [Bacteroidales bacterium]
MSKFSGIIYAMLSSAAFGLIPLFTLPLIESGMHTPSVIFYRMLFSVIMLAVLIVVKRSSFKVNTKQLKTIFGLSFFYAATSLLLIESYLYIPSGIATTISFLYPVAVTLILFFGFKERISSTTLIAILLSLLGVFLLSGSTSQTTFQPIGLVCVITTIFTYSAYIVGINKTSANSVDSLTLSFYVLLFTCLFFAVNVFVRGDLEPIESTLQLGSLLLLGFIPTVLSNLFLLLALKRADSATVSLFGCMEPLTALGVGVLVFKEELDIIKIAGVILVILAVILVILRNKKQ